uniref:Thyrotropin-releasing hormone receptor n=1 Tax=Timema tahoe TaxID=61484 RepID=A0A7R9FFS0_9NEOP|nr:unnamed protein product [Timema tahoe]
MVALVFRIDAAVVWCLQLSRARRIVYGVWVFATVYCCPWLGLTTTRLLGYKGYPGARSCDFKLPRHHYLAYFFADLVVFYVLPLIISCVLYGLITRVLFTRRFGVDKSNNRLQGNATSSTSSSKDQERSRVKLRTQADDISARANKRVRPPRVKGCI